MEEKYVGIDIHRDYGVACVQDPQGKIMYEFRFGNDIEGINKVKDKLGGRKTHIAVESTGNMWVVFWDKLDAKMLAKLLRGDMLVCSYVPPRDVMSEIQSGSELH